MITAIIVTKGNADATLRTLDTLEKYNLDFLVVEEGFTEEQHVAVSRYTPWITTRDLSGETLASSLNAAAKLAHTDDILVMYPGETVGQMNMDELLEAIEQHSGQIGLVHRISAAMEDDSAPEEELSARLYNRTRYTFTGEDKPKLSPLEETVAGSYVTDVVIWEAMPDPQASDIAFQENRLEEFLSRHAGADLGEARPEIQREAAELIFQTGRACYLQREYENAAEYFGMGLSFDELDVKAPFVEEMVIDFGYSLIYSGQTKQALVLEAVYENFDQSADFLYLMGMIYRSNGRSAEAMEEYKKAVACPNARKRGVNSYLAHYRMGELWSDAEQVEKARKEFEACGSYEPARERLEELNL
ncbi:MAG: tetratricopeptide repeat protein [Lachnospiraceae bacterium]|nr:tetratricopeptide repeat protein [Lachnospiraceae bacterium]